MSESFDHEGIILHAILNDDNSLKLFGMNRNVALYNDKELRDAANALVTQGHLQGVDMDIVTKTSRKRKIVDADERVKNSRDRNREHAKNTRLRKKAYVSKLKDLVEQLKTSRIIDTSERQNLANQLFMMQSQRKSAAVSFLKYRTENVRSREQWSTILDEGFIFTLPITPFRYFHKNEIKDGRRVICGIDAVIADTASLGLMTECIGQGSQTWKENTMREEFHKLYVDISAGDVVCSGDNVLCRINVRVVNERAHATVCMQAAMLHCRFDRQNKITSAELIFDVMNFINQIQRVSGISPESSIVPNTLDMVLLESSEARAIVANSLPYRIMFVNKAWTKLTGYSQYELEGREYWKLFHESHSDLSSIQSLFQGCSRAIPGRIIFNTTDSALFKDQSTRRCYMKMIPLTSSSTEVSHLLLSLTSLEEESSMMSI